GSAGGAADRRAGDRPVVVLRAAAHAAREGRPACPGQRQGPAGTRPVGARRSMSGLYGTAQTPGPPDDERRTGQERRSGGDRRDEQAVPLETDRRSGVERRSGEDRRSDRVTADQLSLGRRLRQRRTIGSLVLPLVLLVLFALVVLGLASGYWSFRGRLPDQVQIVCAIGVGVVLALAAGLLPMRNFGRRVIVALPLPHRILEFYDRFEEGVFSAVGLRQLPRLIVITGFIWATEAMRLLLVVEALGFGDVHLGISGAFFVALTGS